MSQDFVIALLAGLGGMLGWGLADFFAKKTIDEIGDIVSLVWAHILGTLSLVAIVLYRFFIGHHGISMPHGAGEWELLASFGVLQGIIYLLVYIGFGKGQVAVLNPIFASFSGLTALLSIIFFKEVISGSLILILIIIFAGVILLSADIQALKRSHFDIFHAAGSKQVLTATLFAGFWTLFWDRFVSGQDWIAFAMYMYLFMTVALLIYARVRSIDLRFNKPSVWKFLLFIGFFEVLAYLSISWGYSVTTHTSVVALLSGAFSIPTILLARAFLKERVTRSQTLGSIMVILGIILLVL